MARIAVFDPFSGASGDMILGALVDAGVPLPVIRGVAGQLGLGGVAITTEPVDAGAVRGSRVRVADGGDQPPRDWRQIRSLLERAPLETGVRDAALAVFTALARVEAEAHGVPEDDVQFHEVGGVDAIVDIVGACAGLHHLGVDRVVSYPVAVGAGWVRMAHGLLPVPAPATALLLNRAGIPIRPNPPSDEQPGELLTPTGAALLATLARFEVPSFAPERLGYGFGSRELAWPNALRLWIGETPDDPGQAGQELLIETNIDDMNPQFFAPLSDRLFAAGALDVWLTPVTMKKGRPATVVSVIAPAGRRDAVVRTLIVETTTLGVRVSPIARTKALRAFATVATRWGDVRLKLRGWEGRVIGAAPEYDDCLRLSESRDVPIRDVWAEANRLGEVFIGQRWNNSPAQESAPRA
jgi:hypothetical protein